MGAGLPLRDHVSVGLPLPCDQYNNLRASVWTRMWVLKEKRQYPPIEFDGTGVAHLRRPVAGPENLGLSFSWEAQLDSILNNTCQM